MVRSVIATVLAATLFGCTAVRPLRDPAAYIQGRHPHRVLVTRGDGSSTTVYHPHVVDSAIVGFDGVNDVTLPIGKLQSVEGRVVDRRRTALLVGAGTVVGVAAVLSVTVFRARSYYVCTCPCRDCIGSEGLAGCC